MYRPPGARHDVTVRTLTTLSMDTQLALDAYEARSDLKDQIAAPAIRHGPIDVKAELERVVREGQLGNRTLLRWTQVLHSDTNTSSIAGHRAPMAHTASAMSEEKLGPRSE